MKLDRPDNNSASHVGILAVVLIIVAITSVSGFFMGMKQTAREGDGVEYWQESEDISASDSKKWPVAPRYVDIPQSDWKVNHDWVNSLDNLPRAGLVRTPQVKMEQEQRSQIVKERNARRAYDGAPPVIPHPIKYRDVQSCTACHGQQAKVLIAGKHAPAMSHPFLSNCTQCHVAAADFDRATTAERNESLSEGNAFVGLLRMGKGSRAFLGAPPTVPHPLSMRQNCMSCHGPNMPNAIVTSHPQRRNCLQCHAPDAGLDIRESFSQPEPVNK